MLEMLTISGKKGGTYLPPPDPSSYLFLASAVNTLTPDLSGGKTSTGSSGVTKVLVEGHDTVFSAGYITYNYTSNLTPFRRGARIDAMVYLDPPNNLYPSGRYPCLIGFMGLEAGNYWSFGPKGISGNVVLCFYGWNGTETQFNSTVPIEKGWHLLGFEMENDGIHLYVDSNEVLFFPLSDPELAQYVNSQGAPSAQPLTMFKFSTGSTRTNTAWVAIR